MSTKSGRKRAGIAPPKPCIFCGARRPLTGEHIFGDWVKKLGFGGEGVHQWSIDSGAPVVHKAGPFAKKLKIVCQPCNGEWMSGMENAVKPLLTPMFQGLRVKLNERAQLDLARWAFKSIVVASHVDRQHERISTAQRRAFHETDEPPRGVTVRIGTASVTPASYGPHVGEYRFLPRMIHVNAPDGAVFDVPAYSGRFRILNVVFDVFGYDSEQWDVFTELSKEPARALLQIWPVKNPTIWWPPVASVDMLGGLSGLQAGERWESIPMLT
jgi:hypothetical protein